VRVCQVFTTNFTYKARRQSPIKPATGASWLACTQSHAYPPHAPCGTSRHCRLTTPTAQTLIRRRGCAPRATALRVRRGVVDRFAESRGTLIHTKRPTWQPPGTLPTFAYPLSERNPAVSRSTLPREVPHPIHSRSHGSRRVTEPPPRAYRAESRGSGDFCVAARSESPSGTPATRPRTGVPWAGLEPATRGV
jgi:hypothetical protein